MIMRYILALVLTIVLLGIARRTSTRHEETLHATVDGTTITHKTVTENFGDGPIIDVKAANTADLAAIVVFYEPNSPRISQEMTPTAEGFTTRLPSLPKGHKWFYHIEISKNGNTAAALPADRDQFIKFKGHVTPLILIPHIFCMFATIFFGALTVFTAFDLTRGRGNPRASVRFLLLTAIFAFIGGFPLGYAVAYQAFGVGWGGIPIGWDITDNKTVILFLFWLITLLLAWRGLSGRKMAISNRTYAALAALSFIVTFITFLIPHSI